MQEFHNKHFLMFVFINFAVYEICLRVNIIVKYVTSYYRLTRIFK